MTVGMTGLRNNCCLHTSIRLKPFPVTRFVLLEYNKAAEHGIWCIATVNQFVIFKTFVIFLSLVPLNPLSK